MDYGTCESVMCQSHEAELGDFSQIKRGFVPSSFAENGSVPRGSEDQQRNVTWKKIFPPKVYFLFLWN